MPTVFREGPYRVYFVSHDLREPPHVHMDRDDASAKVWLDPVQVARSICFSPVELRRIVAMVSRNADRLLEAWHGHACTRG
jgi:hypothetical protein